MPLNLHRVFSGAPEKDYISALGLGARKELTLRAARDEIRANLLSAFGHLGQFSRVKLFEAATSAPPSLRPKFRMQGSFSYHTCNEPAHTPPQQVDLDDGMFVPISYLHANGEPQRPSLLSEGLFIAVEQVLGPLCTRKGWRLNKRKPSCVRIELDDSAHIDLALYSVPDGEFKTLVEKVLMAKDAGDRREMQDQLANDELPESVYRALAQGHIMLAHRIEGWKPSDPRKLEDWFKAAVDDYGPLLRRICRYLKGWRDFTWDACRLSSIVLMAAAVQAFEEDSTLADRDDKALLAVCEKLPGILAGEVPNPVVPGQRLDENWSAEDRAEYVSAAEQLVNYVRDALASANARIALSQLQSGFGSRIPTDLSLVANDNSVDFKATTPAIILQPEALRRAEVAARDIEARGQQSKPWAS